MFGKWLTTQTFRKIGMAEVLFSVPSVASCSKHSLVDRA
jgi:hypothetical protein